MKSKRAYNEIYRDGVDTPNVPPYAIFEQYQVAEIVEIAEQDARERAVRALCKHASCNWCDGTEHERDCGGLRDFLKYYDDEARIAKN